MEYNIVLYIPANHNIVSLRSVSIIIIIYNNMAKTPKRGASKRYIIVKGTRANKPNVVR